MTILASSSIYSTNTRCFERHPRHALSGFSARFCSTAPQAFLRRDRAIQQAVVGVFPDEASIIRLIGAVLQQNDEGQLQRRDRPVEEVAELPAPATGRSGIPRARSADRVRRRRHVCPPLDPGGAVKPRRRAAVRRRRRA